MQTLDMADVCTEMVSDEHSFSNLAVVNVSMNEIHDSTNSDN